MRAITWFYALINQHHSAFSISHFTFLGRILSITVNIPNEAALAVMVEKLLHKQDSLANAKVSARQPCTSKTDFDMK